MILSQLWPAEQKSIGSRVSGWSGNWEQMRVEWHLEGHHFWSRGFILSSQAHLTCGDRAKQRHLHAHWVSKKELWNTQVNFSKVLGKGWCRWRHAQVFKSIADDISKVIKDSQHTKATAKAIYLFEGQRPHRTSKSCSDGLVSTAQEWGIKGDIERQLRIPPHFITQSSLRPDIIVVSECTKHLILLELILPWEERMEEAHERKQEKYQVLQCHVIYTTHRNYLKS